MQKPSLLLNWKKMSIHYCSITFLINLAKTDENLSLTVELYIAVLTYPVYNEH